MRPEEMICMIENKPKAVTNIKVGDILKQGGRYFYVLKVEIRDRTFEPVCIYLQNIRKWEGEYRLIIFCDDNRPMGRCYYPGVYDTGDCAQEEPMVKVNFELSDKVLHNREYEASWLPQFMKKQKEN